MIGTIVTFLMFLHGAHVMPVLFHYAETHNAPEVLGLSTIRDGASVFPDALVPSDTVPSTHVTATPLRAPEPPQRIENDGYFTLPDAHAAAVVDAASGSVIYTQNATVRRPIASLTKLYTAYIVRTSGVSLDAPVTIHASSLAVGGSRVGCPSSVACHGARLYEGEVVTVRDLLTMMLVASANDAAMALARYVAGTEDDFVAVMNARALELGLHQSHFCTPSGLELEDNTGCYSSAEDIARIGVLALHDDVIWQLLSMKEATIAAADGKTVHHVEATNRFAKGETIAVPKGLLGAKTGFTPQAGESLLVAARNPENPSATVVAVTLGDVDRWNDMVTLVDWIWKTYTWPVAS